MPYTLGLQPFSIEDAAAYPYAAGVPGSKVDVVGIFSIAQRATVTATSIRGDNAVLSNASSFDSAALTIDIHAHNFASLAAVGAGVSASSGTTPNQINTLTRKTTDVLADFKLSGQTHSKDAATGGFQATWFRCQWASGPDFALADSAFAPITMGATAIGDGTSQVFQLSQYETFTALV